MARNKEIKKERNDAIIKRFNALASLKRDGVEVYNYRYIINKIRHEFYLGERTIEDIVRTHVLEDRPDIKQLKIEL